MASRNASFIETELITEFTATLHRKSRHCPEFEHPLTAITAKHMPCACAQAASTPVLVMHNVEKGDKAVNLCRTAATGQATDI